MRTTYNALKIKIRHVVSRLETGTEYLNRNKFMLFIIIFIYFLIYSSISLVNHYYFRTTGWDLGLFNNALYDYIHLQWNKPTLLLPYYDLPNRLADHFSLTYIFFAPFYYIFGSYTLLIVQIVFVIIGGIGIYKLVLFITRKKLIATLAVIHFFSMWGIFSALAYDYHDNVIAAMVVPWFFYFVYKNQFWKASFIAFFILIAKENMAFWLLFICLGSIFLFRRDRLKLRFLSILSLISIVYFILIVKFVIPSFAPLGKEYIHFKYNALGENFEKALITIITKPFYTISLLFKNHINDPVADGIKKEMHLVILFSGGIALLIRPQFLIMLLPIYGQKLFNDYYGKWGLNAQYSIEFAPILTIALFCVISNINKNNIKYILGLIFVILCIATTKITLDHRVSKWYNKTKAQFYAKEHYQQEFDLNVVHDKLKMIPDNPPISAQHMLTPHLAFRDVIYYFPYIGDARYIALLPGAFDTYPLKKKEYYEKIKELKESLEWNIMYDDGILIIFQRN